MKKDYLVIDRKQWRTGGDGYDRTGDGGTQLLNAEGFMCCLGIRACQMGVPKDKLIGEGEPADVNGWIIPDLINSKGENTLFTKKAMEINDDEDMTQQEREGKIIKHFATKNIIVIFKGKYRK